ncbi:MAG: response regulator [Chloroflexota bacterium]
MRVLVADDHSLFRDGITSLLQAAGFNVVGQAGDGNEAVSETLRLRPDLVLMDITMPQMTGLEALREIKHLSPETPVVMLTVSNEDRDLMQAVKNGAMGYLMKDLTATEFLRMLEGIQRGEAAMTRKTAARLLGFLGSDTPRPCNAEADLTSRELELLRLVVEGLSNKAIAQSLSISENTVKYHMKNIFQKLNVQNRTEAATCAIQVGLLKAAPSD